MLLNFDVGEDPWESLRKLNLSILKEISPEYSLEELMLKLWPPDAKNWLTAKAPDAGEDWRKDNGMTEDEKVGWYLWLNGHEFEQALGVGDGEGSLVCCSPWGPKESDTTEQLNWMFQEKLTSLKYSKITFTNSGNMSVSYMKSPIRIRFRTHMLILSITKMSRK